MEAIANLLELEADAEVSILLVDDTEIRKLNHEYRGKDYATDVLSFPLEEETEDEIEPIIVGGPEGRMLGDIVISIETAAAQAKNYGHTFERELTFLLLHGLLHLLGYDHERNEIDAQEMRDEEKRILLALGSTR